MGNEGINEKAMVCFHLSFEKIQPNYFYIPFPYLRLSVFTDLSYSNRPAVGSGHIRNPPQSLVAFAPLSCVGPP